MDGGGSKCLKNLIIWRKSASFNKKSTCVLSSERYTRKAARQDKQEEQRRNVILKKKKKKLERSTDTYFYQQRKFVTTVSSTGLQGRDVFTSAVSRGDKRSSIFSRLAPLKFDLIDGLSWELFPLSYGLIRIKDLLSHVCNVTRSFRISLAYDWHSVVLIWFSSL